MTATRHRRISSGFSYVEVLIVSTLLMVLLSPLLDALQANSLSGEISDQLRKERNHACSTVESVLALPIATLLDEASALGSPLVPSDAYSDAAAAVPRALVYLSTYDADNADADNNPFTGTEADLLWVRVVIENSAIELQTLANR